MADIYTGVRYTKQIPSSSLWKEVLELMKCMNTYILYVRVTPHTASAVTLYALVLIASSCLRRYKLGFLP